MTKDQYQALMGVSLLVLAGTAFTCYVMQRINRGFGAANDAVQDMIGMKDRVDELVTKAERSVQQGQQTIARVSSVANNIETKIDQVVDQVDRLSNFGF